MNSYTRREIAKLALSALPAIGLWSTMGQLRASESLVRPIAKPNSKVAGVQLGINVPYSFRKPAMPGDEILKNCLQLGLSAVELRAQPVEIEMGAPAEFVFAPASATAKGDAAAKESTQAKAAAAESRAEKLRSWRLGAPMDRARAFRRKWEEAGVLIEIVKIDDIYKMKDDVLDYCFELAKNLGARALSCEISFKAEDIKRLGQFADKHELRVGYHGHTAVTPAIWEQAFALAKYNGANVDLGHFVAGNNFSPVEFIKKYHDRITHIHLKDRKLHNGPNVPFGEGDTPIAEVLRMIRDNHWNIQATIEFEYPVPENSDLMTEIARTIKYCRDALA
jgi:Xylose isomerase-like TIM barrel